MAREEEANKRAAKSSEPSLALICNNALTNGGAGARELILVGACCLLLAVGYDGGSGAVLMLALFCSWPL